MDAVEYVKQRERMCDYYMNCDKCPAKKVVSCASITKISQMAPIVQQWAKEHPVKTRNDEFFNQWPDAEIGYDGYPSVTPCQLYKDMEEKDENGVCCKKCGCDKCRRDFWLKEIE